MTTTNLSAGSTGSFGSRAGKITYWIATIWLALGMIATGTGQLLQWKAGQGGTDMIMRLGYPVYFLTILGIWKILGVVAVLIPKFPLLKEWAYAGFFFVMTGAMFSHVAVGDPVNELIPSVLLLILTGVSWYFRPLDRKLAASPQRVAKDFAETQQREFQLINK
jgi:uncharacterized membrane protein YphA (DoxX/SURF4 family)